MEVKLAEVTIRTETLLSAVGCTDIKMFEKIRNIYEDIPDEVAIHVAIKKHYDERSCPVCRSEPAIRSNNGRLHPGMMCRGQGYVVVRVPKFLRRLIERVCYAQ